MEDESLRKFGELSIRCVPHFHGVDVAGNDVLQVGC
jgi:hypothetical protein